MVRERTKYESKSRAHAENILKKSIGIYRRREICLIVHWKRAQHTRCLVWWGAVARASNGNGTSHRQKDTPKYRSNASFKAIRYGERKAMMRENRKRNSVRNKETHGIIKRKEERIRREKKRITHTTQYKQQDGRLDDHHRKEMVLRHLN